MNEIYDRFMKDMIKKREKGGFFFKKKSKYGLFGMNFSPFTLKLE